MNSSVPWFDMETVKCLYARNDDLRTAKHDVNGSSEIRVQQNLAMVVLLTTSPPPHPKSFLETVRSIASFFF
jgi:hypothetical protein